MKQKVCVIVDGFSTGKLIAPILKRCGYPCIHLITSKEFYKELLKMITITIKKHYLLMIP